MSRTELILQQIAELTPEEREIVYQSLKQRAERVARVEAALAELSSRPPSTGVWGPDAQTYIDQQRADDRF